MAVPGLSIEFILPALDPLFPCNAMAPCVSPRSLPRCLFRVLRASREELPLHRVDLCQLLRGMLQAYPNLQPSEADVIIDCDGVAPVLGNQAGLVQCFSNLLGNAVKFVRAIGMGAPLG